MDKTIVSENDSKTTPADISMVNETKTGAVVSGVNVCTCIPLPFDTATTLLPAMSFTVELLIAMYVLLDDEVNTACMSFRMFRSACVGVSVKIVESDDGDVENVPPVSTSEFVDVATS